MSLIRLGFWAASGAVPAIRYWLATLGSASGDEGQGVAIGSEDELYLTGFGEGAYVIKYDSSGSLVFDKQFASGGVTRLYSIAIDSLDNLYASGWTTLAGAGSTDFLLVKYNSSGTIQWQRVLGDSDPNQSFAGAIDSADNFYVCGRVLNPSWLFQIAKYNSSGTIQWQKELGNGDEQAYGIVADSSDNVYVAGYTESTGAGGKDFLLAKYNSSGTIQWQRVLGGSGIDYGLSVTVDSLDNVYVAGYTDSTGAGGFDFLLAKYNSSGTIQWQRVLGDDGTQEAHSVTVDSSDNVYVAGESSTGSFNFLIAKYNSSGTIQWQRVLGGSGGEVAYSIKINSENDICVVGNTDSTGAGGEDVFIAKLPSDGSLTGTYVLDGVNIVYAASTLTAATSTLTAATSSLTAATSTLTAATSTLTDASASLTSHFVEIPA